MNKVRTRLFSCKLLSRFTEQACELSRIGLTRSGTTIGISFVQYARTAPFAGRAKKFLSPRYSGGSRLVCFRPKREHSRSTSDSYISESLTAKPQRSNLTGNVCRTPTTDMHRTQFPGSP